MTRIEQWGVFEFSLDGPTQGNPFVDAAFSAEFRLGHRRTAVDGFYDGEGVYRARFMPDEPGEWTFVTRGNHPALDGAAGRFECVAPAPGNHGPVRVRDRFHFAYADGTRFSNLGTTCYAWAHQPPERVERTLQSLRAAPFNKLRMCVFPKSYRWNNLEPPLYPFPVVRQGSTSWDGHFDNRADSAWAFDWGYFVPAYFRNIETLVARLGAMGIEADLILLHPYDRWGFARMPAEVEDRYLRHVCARLSAFRNVWWSFANEWDFMRQKTEADWERYARVVRAHDPFAHLRGIHNGHRLYDHGKPWVTHVSFQGHPNEVARLRREYGKPVVVDECCYEGDIPNGWGNISAAELTWRFWLATCLGGYCGHGETYLHPQDILWWSHGGDLRGSSPARIAFLRGIVEQRVGGYEPIDVGGHIAASRDDGRELLLFTHDHQPRLLEATLPPGGRYSAEVIDPWEMTLAPLPGAFEGKCVIPMPARPYLAVRARRTSS